MPDRRTASLDFDTILSRTRAPIWAAGARSAAHVVAYARRMGPKGVTIDDVRALASTFERSYEVLVRDRVKFRVGQIVYLAFSRDDTMMGFAFPKEERDGLVNAEPHKFMMPKAGDIRYNWVVVRLAEIDHAEMTELVVDAWRMVVPKKVFAAYESTQQHGEPIT
jgi:hypothetical protein